MDERQDENSVGTSPVRKRLAALFSLGNAATCWPARSLAAGNLSVEAFSLHFLDGKQVVPIQKMGARGQSQEILFHF